MSGKVYHHVFGCSRELGSQWFHEFSADTASDARDETDSMKNQGYLTRVIRSAKSPAELLAQVQRESEEDKAAKFVAAVVRAIKRNGDRKRAETRQWARFIDLYARSAFDVDEKPPAADAIAYAIECCMDGDAPKPAAGAVYFAWCEARDGDEIEEEFARDLAEGGR